MNIKCLLSGHCWCHWNKHRDYAPSSEFERLVEFLNTQHRTCNNCGKIQHWKGGWTRGKWLDGEAPDIK